MTAPSWIGDDGWKIETILKNDIFQGFIFSVNDELWLSRGLVIHPYKAYRTIRKNLKKTLKQEGSELVLLLNQLARQQLRHKRHEHVSPKVFYADDSC